MNATLVKQACSKSSTMHDSGRTVIAPGAALKIVNAYAVYITNRTLENAGAVLFAGPGGLSMNSGVITNDAGATFSMGSPNSFSYLTLAWAAVRGLTTPGPA